MPQGPNKLSQFWQELNRRNVVRVITVYVAVAFMILEAVDIIFPRMGFPDWTVTLVIFLLAIGLIISIILSWIYDIHPEGGMVKTEPADKVKAEEIPRSSSGWKIASYVSFVVIVGLIVLNIIPRTDKMKLSEVLDKSIAVLPFESLSSDTELQYQADGVMDAILLHLSRIEDLKVMSRTSVEQYRNTEKTIPEICEEMGVAYVLEGSFQKSGDQMRLIVQLIKSKEGHVWANNYDREYKDIFMVQSEVAQVIAGELKAVITPEELIQIDKQPTDNLEAYDMYLKGRYFLNKRTERGFKEAIEYFNLAIENDTNYALAYTGLADCYNMVATYAYISSKDDIENSFHRSKEAALKALEIDNTLAAAFTSLASVKLFYEWDWKGALKDFERAIELNPDYATAHHWYSNCLMVFERYDESIVEAKRARELEPLSPIINRAVLRRLYSARRYDQVIEESLNALNITPDYYLTHSTLGLTYLQKGMFSNAISEMQKATKYSGDDLVTKALLGYVYGATGNQDNALAILNSLIETSEEGYVPSISIAYIYIGLGDKDNAISMLEQAYEEHSTQLIYLNTNPIYDPLRSDPRFIELVNKMSFEK